jgi:hypothetical protein
MIAKELHWLDEKHIISLADTSKGVPNIILELVRMVLQGRNPGSITGEQVFLESVREIFAEAAADIEKTSGISKTKTIEFLQLVTLLSPLQLNEDDKKFIAQLLELRIDKIGSLTQALSDHGLLEMTPAVSIKPDPYSDALLVEAIQKSNDFIQFIINAEGVEKHLDNILKNLSAAEITNDNRKSFIENLIRKYVSQLEDSNDPKKIVSIFNLVEKITPYKSWAGIYAINQFIRFQDDTAHPTHIVIPWSNQTYLSKLNSTVSDILYALTNYSKYSWEYKDQLFEIVVKLVRETGNLDFVNKVYGYHEWSFSHNYYHPPACCFQQQLLSNYILQHLRPDALEWQINFCLRGVAILLNLEYDMEQYYEPATMKLSFGIAQVLYCSHVEAIRTEIINKAIEFYHAAAQAHKDFIMNHLLNYFFYCSNGFDKHHNQKLDKEIIAVLAFFKNLLEANPTLQEKTRVAGSIARYLPNGYKPDFDNQVQALKTLATTAGSNREAMELLLMNTNYFEVRIHFKNWLAELRSKYSSFDDFSKDLLAVGTSTGSSSDKLPPQFNNALITIGNEWPDKAKKLFQTFQNSHPDLIPISVVLVTPSYKEVAYFDSVIAWLWEQKERYIYQVLWMITVGRNNDITFFKKSELEYIEYVIDNEITSCYDLVAYNLINYAYIDKELTFMLLDKLIKRAPEKIKPLSYTLFKDNKTYEKDFTAEIKTLLYNNLAVIDLEELETAFFLEFIDTHFGFDELVFFITKQAETSKKELDFYRRTGGNPYINHNLTEDENAARYARIVQLYIDNYETDTQAWQTVLNKFSSGYVFTPAQKKALEPLIIKNSQKLDNLLLLAQAIRFYEQYSEEGITTLCEISEQCLKISVSQKLIDVFGNSFYSNLGSKSKTSIGVAYKEDIAKKALLETIIATKSYSTTTINFLEKCLANVNEDIKRTIEEDRLNHGW